VDSILLKHTRMKDDDIGLIHYCHLVVIRGGVNDS
jgi:hypothetical protein